MPRFFLSLTLLFASLAFAQQGDGQFNGGLTRGNLLRNPDYRTPGTGAQSYYVDGATGSDSFDCRSTTTPCLTIQGGINKVPKLLRDLVTVNIAAGTYTAGFTVSGFVSDTGIQQSTAGLYINGALTTATLTTGSATGTATAGSAGSTSTFGTLTDGAATWTVNDLRGRFITTATPTNTTLVISSNTATVITVVGTWSAPTGSTTYTILDPSVIVTGAATLPPPPTGSAIANRAAIEITDNNINYRADGITLANMRLANAAGAGIEVSDNGSYLFSTMQIRPAASSGMFSNTLTATGTNRVAFTKCDVFIATTSSNALFLSSGVLVSNNTLWRGAGATSTTAAIQGTTAGGFPRLGAFTASEIADFLHGVRLGFGTGSTFTNNRITCGTSSGIAFAAGSFVNDTLGQPVSIGAITATNIATCGIGVQVWGPGTVEVASMTGAAGTTGFAAENGGAITFAKAGVTMTAGTNEINLDSGDVTATFADVTAGSCIIAAPTTSRVCGR